MDFGKKVGIVGRDEKPHGTRIHFPVFEGLGYTSVVNPLRSGKLFIYLI